MGCKPLFDRWEYTIPANTAEENAVRVECRISPGTLKSVHIFFPLGCQGLARCRVFLGEKPVAPRSAKNFISGDDTLVKIDNLHDLISENVPVLNWDVWNLDETFSHTPWMSAEWISADEPYEKTMTETLKDFVTIMKKLIGV